MGPRTTHEIQGEAGYTVFNVSRNYYCFLSIFELCFLPVIWHMVLLTQCIEESGGWWKPLAPSTLKSSSTIDFLFVSYYQATFICHWSPQIRVFLIAVGYILWSHEFPFTILKPKAQETNWVTHQGKPLRKECTMKTTSALTAFQLLSSNISHSKILHSRGSFLMCRKSSAFTFSKN